MTYNILCLSFFKLSTYLCPKLLTERATVVLFKTAVSNEDVNCNFGMLNKTTLNQCVLMILTESCFFLGGLMTHKALGF